MKEKLTALLLISVMVVSAFGAIGLSATKVSALAATTLTLSSTNYAPSAGQQYTLSGSLTDSAGNPLAGKPIEISYNFEDATGWHYSNTIYTGADGTYTTATTSSKTVALTVKFPGDSVYYGAWGNVVTINVQKASTLTLSSTNYNPSTGKQYTLSGYLRDYAGNALKNQPIDIFYHFPGEAWQFSNIVHTNADGWYSTVTSSSKTVILQTGYKVGGVYVVSSNLVTINVAAPTLTLSSTSYSHYFGQQYTLSGLLTDAAGNPLANKPIDVFYHFWNEGWHYSNTVYTGADGKYSTTTSSSQTVYLQTGYKVGGVYVVSSNLVTVIVWQW